ncbi:hypothetical protein GCM10025861_19540 [Methanobacterium petrolearium]|nr:hypothetical protein GCM10025861_02020 [Methanobacterium petrolearium]BDZ70651.1 hypothetical protein GCM10025861_11680 [Methanobacterium petrolearium]BDZ71437.1 hypothetical protein GCM10025861_19540 [Methanobacterium petrolearium]
MLILFKMEFNLDLTYGLFEFLILILTRKLIKSNVLDPSGKSINDLPFIDWNPIPVTENLSGFFFKMFFVPFLYQIRPELPIF